MLVIFGYSFIFKLVKVFRSLLSELQGTHLLRRPIWRCALCSLELRRDVPDPHSKSIFSRHGHPVASTPFLEDSIAYFLACQEADCPCSLGISSSAPPCQAWGLALFLTPQDDEPRLYCNLPVAVKTNECSLPPLHMEVLQPVGCSPQSGQRLRLLSRRTQLQHSPPP